VSVNYLVRKSPAELGFRDWPVRWCSESQGMHVVWSTIRALMWWLSSVLPAISALGFLFLCLDLLDPPWVRRTPEESRKPRRPEGCRNSSVGRTRHSNPAARSLQSRSP
jgi:hypothetical protein